MLTKSQLYAGGRTQRRFLAALGCLTLMLGSASVTAQVLINPVIIELGPRQNVASISVALSEKASAPIRLQAQLLRWNQDLQGTPVTEESDELVVTPPITEISPGEKQVFRIALRGPRAAAGELAYRLVLEDIGPAMPMPDNPDGLSLYFHMRYDLPVLIAPAGPVRNAMRWSVCPAPAKQPNQACVRLVNDGNRRVKLQSLTLLGQNWQQVVSWPEGENVLSGAQREWRVALTAGHSGALRGIALQTMDSAALPVEASEP